MGYLKSSEGEEGDADVPVGGMGNAGRVAAEFKTGSPSGDTDDVGRGLAGYMEVKPGRVG